jgi:hypothetical protein
VTASVPQHCNNREGRNSLKKATEDIFSGTRNFRGSSRVIDDTPKTFFWDVYAAFAHPQFNSNFAMPTPRFHRRNTLQK